MNAMPSKHMILLFTASLLAVPLLCVAQTPSQKISLKVNLGGPPVGDFLGEEQVLDMTDFSKNVARIPIQNTDQPEIFQSQRFSRCSDFTIRIPVPDGIYQVTLLFAETFKPACVPGARVFDISLGTPVSGVSKVIEGFDVFQSAGCEAAHGKRFDKVPSKDGIVVHLIQRAQHPSMAGFIVEGFPVVKGDGSDYKAIARSTADEDGGQGSGMSSIGLGTPYDSMRNAALESGNLGNGSDSATGIGTVPSPPLQSAPGPQTGFNMGAHTAVTSSGDDVMTAGVLQEPRVNGMDGALGLGGGSAVAGTPMDMPPAQAAPGMEPDSWHGAALPYQGRRRLLSLDTEEEEMILAGLSDENFAKPDKKRPSVGFRRLQGISVRPGNKEEGFQEELHGILSTE